MDDDLFLINDIENEYKKLSNDCKKKYPKIKEIVDFALKALVKIKTTLTKNSNHNPEIVKQFRSELHLSMEIIIKPIILISEGKYSKLNLSCILILKKMIIYNYITENEFDSIIKILKEMYDSSNEDTQLKILEAMQSLFSINITKISGETLDNIMIIFSRIFTFRNIETKNALQLMLGSFMKKIFDYVDEKTIINLLKSLVSLSEGTKKDWINQPSISSKCLGLELITTIIETYPQKLKSKEFQPILNEDIKILIQKVYAMNTEPIIGIKICRLTVILVNTLNTLYELIEGILKFIGKNNQVLWERIIGLECLCELFKNQIFLYGVYTSYKELYEKMLINFTDVVYQSFLLKSKNITSLNETINSTVNISLLKKQSESLSKLPNKKYISSNMIICESDSILITQNMNYVYKLLTESFVNLRNSFVNIMEENGINVNINILDKLKKEQKSGNISNQIDLNKKKKQKLIQDMICCQFVNLKGGLIGMLINFSEVSTVQTFISIFQSFIYIYTSFDLISSRNELLDDLCKLAIPNNLGSIFEIKEKNILIIRVIFNLAHCINLLDYHSWIILIETIQNLYFILVKSGCYLYDSKEQFNINIIMFNLLSNIKKYSYNLDISEIEHLIQEKEGESKNFSSQININLLNNPKDLKQKNKSSGQIISTKIDEMLTSEQKENIEILSNVVNNLFVESNDYDNDILCNIIKALYDTINKIFNDYIKEKKELKSQKNMESENKKITTMSILPQDIIYKETNKENGQESARNKQNNILSNIGNKFLFSSVLTNTGFNNNNNSNNNPNINSKLNSSSLQNEKLLSNLTYINFNLVKMFGIAVINLNRIDLFWNIITDTVNLLSSNSVNNRFSNLLSKFTIEIYIQIIIVLLTQYKTKEPNLPNFYTKELQNTLFKPIFSFLNRHHNISYVLEPLQKILEKCGTKLDTSGWNSFINILNQILSNEKVDSQQCENVFKIIEQIFNEYSIYLNVFNIEHILNVLEKFSVSKDNNNICYNSISLFWQCADILENYQKEKKPLSKEECNLANITLNSTEEKNKFFGNIWKNIFFKLININNDERFDIRKCCINVFTQFYVAKIKSLNKVFNIKTSKIISEEIVEDIFFEIVNKNFKSFINNSKNKTSNEVNECEETVVLTLQAIGKVIKCYIEENKNDDVKNTGGNKLFLKLIEMCLDLMKNNTPLISINVLKTIFDIESISEKLFLENLEKNWKIFDKIGAFITDEELFIKKYSNTVNGEKLIEFLVESLKISYSKKKNIDNLEECFNNEMEKLINYIPKIFMAVSYTEYNYINANPRVLIQVEKDIFELIEIFSKKIKGDTLILTIKYLISFILYDVKNPHSGTLCRRCVESLSIIFIHNNYIHLLPKEKLAEIVMYAINMIFNIILGNSNNDIIEYEIKNKNDDTKYIWNFLVEELLYNIIQPIIFDVRDQNLWDKTINMFKDLLNKKNNYSKKGNILFTIELSKICQEMETEIINFIVNILLPKSFFLDIKLQNILLPFIELNSETICQNEKTKSIISLDTMCLNSLFNLCKFKSFEELKKDFDKNNDYIKSSYNKTLSEEEEQKTLKKYIDVKNSITKRCMPILIKRSKESIKIILEEEQKNKNNLLDKSKLEEIKFILINLRDLNFSNENDEKKKENQIYTNEIMKVCQNSTKRHLFLMHFTLSELITFKNEEIRNILKEIFQIISKEMGLNKDNY